MSLRIAGMMVMPNITTITLADIDGSNVSSVQFETVRDRYNPMFDSLVRRINLATGNNELVCVGGIIAAGIDGSGKITRPGELADWYKHNPAADLCEELLVPIRIRGVREDEPLHNYLRRPELGLTVAVQLLKDLER